MKKMIVLEGVDGSGKTTLAKILSRDLELPIASRVVKSEEGPPPKQELVKWLYKELADETPKIYDRFPIYSDPIYTAILKREPNIGKGAVRYFHENYTPFLVLCDPGWSKVKESALNEPQMDGVHTHLESLYSQYRKLHFIDHIYDRTDDGPLGYRFMLELIQDYLEN